MLNQVLELLDNIQTEKGFGYMFIWQMFNLIDVDWMKTLMLFTILDFPIKMKATEITEGSLAHIKLLQKEDKVQPIIDKVSGINANMKVIMNRINKFVITQEPSMIVM